MVGGMMHDTQSLLPRFIAVDLFCGAGGTTRGLLDAGGYVLAGVDKDAVVGATFRANNVNTTLDAAPVLFLNKNVFPSSKACPDGARDELFEWLDREIPRVRAMAPGVPLMFAICAPCQPFTRLASAGSMTKARQAARHRDRNLLAAASEFVARYNPELILSENVATVNDASFGTVWRSFRQRLSKLGYATGSRIVCASNFGIAQVRRRSILLGARQNLVDHALEVDGSLKVPTLDVEAKAVTVADVIGHLPEIAAGERHATVPNHTSAALSELNLKRIRALKPGEPNIVLLAASEELWLPCHRRARERAGKPCFTDAWTRMRPDRPSTTITTRAYKFSNGRFGHPEQDRPISLREAAALQSFQDDYVFLPEGKLELGARLIGNAVPPRLARFFANHLVDLAIRGNKTGMLT